jgi:hypothetical protein
MSFGHPQVAIRLVRAQRALAHDDRSQAVREVGGKSSLARSCGRWSIELFFRWMKEGLKLRHFHGASDNAVRIRAAVALIAFVQIWLACEAQIAIASLSTFARLIRANLLHRMPLGRMRGHAALHPETHRQTSAQPVLL